jgi:hypothetical protein
MVPFLQQIIDVMLDSVRISPVAALGILFRVLRPAKKRQATQGADNQRYWQG